jgi:hypothetical protein
MPVRGMAAIRCRSCTSRRVQAFIGRCAGNNTYLSEAHRVNLMADFQVITQAVLDTIGQITGLLTVFLSMIAVFRCWWAASAL